MRILSAIFFIIFLAGCATDKAEITQCVNENCVVKEISVIGVYETTLPCADCDGIKATLTLKTDNKFELKLEYLQDNDIDLQSGKYAIKDGIITTINLYKEKRLYKIDGLNLKMLDEEANEISGELSEFYNFKRIK
ncbi:copper resistance protein NlpE [Campylobacter mucosalis]|uniref:copper resistance protein NlpE n=1 Tax=Campylobacter mucosalis TaxID=202 RepID=UPI00146FF258|nr:copper resistance protein NlpE [Campylobacter mucosalis]